MSLGQSQDYGEARGRKESSRMLLLPTVDLHSVCFLFSKIKWKSSCSKDSSLRQDITLIFSYSSSSFCFICWCFRSTHDGSSLDLKTRVGHTHGIPAVYTQHPHHIQFSQDSVTKPMCLLWEQPLEEEIVFVSCPMEQANLLHEADWAFHLFSLGSGPDASHVHCEACDRCASGNNTVLWAR